MVNKQYNVETLKRDKNNIHSKKMLDASEFPVEHSSKKLDNDFLKKSNLKELSLSDIGRFQYILQMDKEMVSFFKTFGGKKSSKKKN